MNGKNKQKGLFRVVLYFNEQDITTLKQDAEKSGFRRLGIPIKIQKPHGMADEWLANTDGLAKMLKNCWEYWRKAEPERLRALAEQEELIRQAQERKAALEKGRA